MEAFLGVAIPGMRAYHCTPRSTSKGRQTPGGLGSDKRARRGRNVDIANSSNSYSVASCSGIIKRLLWRNEGVARLSGDGAEDGGGFGFVKGAHTKISR